MSDSEVDASARDFMDRVADAGAEPKAKRKKPASPMSFALKECAKRGWIAGVVERFVHFPPPGHKVDLFGVIDIVAIAPDPEERARVRSVVRAACLAVERLAVTAARVEQLDVIIERAVDALATGCTVGIQATTNTGGQHAKHRAKILAEPRARAWVEAGNRLELWTWAKQGARGKRKTWTLRVERFEVDVWDVSAETALP